MRPYIPPSLHAGGADASEQMRALARAEDIGRGKGRQEGDKDGYARGLAEGDSAARATLEPKLAKLQDEVAELKRQDALGDTLRKVLAARDEDRAAADRALQSALAMALDLVFPALCKAAEGRETVALLQSVMLDRPSDTLVVEANAATLAPLRDLLAPGGALAEQAARVTLKVDEKRNSAASAISWQYGGVQYQPDGLLAQVKAALAPGGAAAATDDDIAGDP